MNKLFFVGVGRSNNRSSNVVNGAVSSEPARNRRSRTLNVVVALLLLSFVAFGSCDLFDDHGSTQADASGLSLPARGVTGTINWPGDEDWFTFTLSSYTTDVDFDLTSNEFGPDLAVLDSTGKIVVSTNGDKAQSSNLFTGTVYTRNWGLPAGTYYVRVKSTTGLDAGVFTLDIY